MVILITGITSGFGRAMAQRLSQDGHKVYGTFRRESEPIPGVTYIKADVRDEDSLKSAVNQVLEAEGRIDTLISNAGMGIGGPLEFTPVDDARLQMDVNFMGMVRLLDQVVPVMRRQRHGHIICISSIGGLMGLPYQGMYSASKFAIEGYCEALRLEVRQFGIHVTVINPGDFSTGFTAQRNKVCNPDAMAAYPGYSQSMESIEHDENTGLKPERLARRISKIVCKRHPRNRYTIATLVQKASVLLKAILPSRWFDCVLGAYYKL
ncbi:MAG: SDR family oxidoreductase [Bacteroidaceae bacterium]|nr:SDR family oxidoreductase [Bacteroidaceae bacterium]